MNENLNAIIGGKSSGKSLLLYLTASSIDPEQVQRTAKRLGFEGYNFETPFDFEVRWKNGDIDKLNGTDEKLHKITYIPQLYINYLVEKNNKEDLNSLIKSILLQDGEFRKFYDTRTTEIENTTADISRLLQEYLETRNKALEIQRQSKELGNSSNIEKGIEKIKENIAKGQEASTLTPDEFAKYQELTNKKTELESSYIETGKKLTALTKFWQELLNTKNYLFGTSDENTKLKGQLDRILEEAGDTAPEVWVIKDTTAADFDTLLENLTNRIKDTGLEAKTTHLTEEIDKIKEELKPYLLKIAGQKELQLLTQQLEAEIVKLQQAMTLEGQLKNLLNDYSELREREAQLLTKRYLAYKSIESKINSTKNNIGSEIFLNCRLRCPQSIFALQEQTNKAAISSEHFFNSLFTDGEVNYDQIVALYRLPLRVTDDKLFYDKEGFIPLKVRLSIEDILRGLVQDNFLLDFTVTYKGDDLLNMSPGKKGTVLLILFLQISSSEYPILIDQPEDNLDNRTIYDLLCAMVKEKKKERQIIIVSHNANLVVSTDAENIIVANQEGQDVETQSDRYRFEYVNGALEHSFTKDSRIPKILQSQGIRQHVCDILEGGNEAFKQRERKYAIK